MIEIRRRMLVSGRVQGVFFRDSCRRVARELGVNGWVRNCTDGTVEVVAEGAPAAVEQLIGWCHEGPPRANVTGVEITEEHPVGAVGFEVRA